MAQDPMTLPPRFKFSLREDLKDEKQFLPMRAEPKATGWDVRAAMPDRKPLVIQPFEQVKIPLGFRAFCPHGWWYEVKPRSSTFTKRFLHALYGTVDETYGSELVFACQYIPTLRSEIFSHSFKAKLSAIVTNTMRPLTINWGDAIGQIIPIERQEMDVIEIANEEYNKLVDERGAIRKTGGFGSTDAQ